MMIPNKIFELNLDPYDISVFMVIKRNNPSHPGYQHFKNKLSISKKRLWKSLNGLKNCNVIQWERGCEGRSNFYTVMPEGVWTKKSKLSTKDPSLRRPTSSLLRILPPVPQGDANKTNSIILNNKKDENRVSLLLKQTAKNLKF